MFCAFCPPTIWATSLGFCRPKSPRTVGKQNAQSMRVKMTLHVNHEDVNGEKLTVKKWWIFGADFSRFTQSFSRFMRDINGEKNISLLMIFFTVSFSRFAPSRVNSPDQPRSYVRTAAAHHGPIMMVVQVSEVLAPHQQAPSYRESNTGMHGTRW